MPSKAARANRSISGRLESKVLSLVRRYVEDESSQSPQPNLLLSAPAIYAFVCKTDPSLQRSKKPPIAKAIEAAIDIILEEEADEELGDLDSELEMMEDEGRLMVPLEPNIANKRITEMWGMAPTPRRGVTPEVSTPKEKGMAVEPVGTAGSVVVPETAPGSPKKKRRLREKEKEEGEKKRRKAGDTNRDPPQWVSLEDLGGMDEIYAQLIDQVVVPLKHPELYQATGIKPPRGVLLHGPPGCGKTMLANAIASALNVPFISISAPSIVSGMSGESEKKVRELFDEAREKAPCLMFVDEIDAVTPKRESAQREMERRIVAQFLTCMDELSPEKNDWKTVVIIGATNRPDSLDPALRRAGRFDHEICLNVPDEEARAKILQVQTRNLRLAEEFDFKMLAKKTPGFVGADLGSLVSAAGVVAQKRILVTLRKGPLQIDKTSEEPPKCDSFTGVPDDNTMEIDIQPVDLPNGASNTTPLPSTQIPTAPSKADNPITRFLEDHPDPFTHLQLAPCAISMSDFLSVIPKIQPSSKREGFATVPDVTWDDIGALHPIRQEMEMSIVHPIAYPEAFSAVGITAPTGILLWGPPGCGKTLLAKAVANESKANFISVRGPELLNKYVGESERAVRQVFSRARASKPCVIFFDELDALVPRRDDAMSESSSRVVNTLLTELDGLEDRRGVYVIGATNRPDVIDPAMLRPGRLDKPLLVDLPTPSERAEILKTLTKNRPLMADVDIEKLAHDERAQNFSGADLASLVREAGIGALRNAFFDEEGRKRDVVGKGSAGIGMKEFEKALGTVRPSVGGEERREYKRLAGRFGIAGSR